MFLIVLSIDIIIEADALWYSTLDDTLSSLNTILYWYSSRNRFGDQSRVNSINFSAMILKFSEKFDHPFCTYVTELVSHVHFCLALCSFGPPSRALVAITWRGVGSKIKQGEEFLTNVSFVFVTSPLCSDVRVVLRYVNKRPRLLFITVPHHKISVCALYGCNNARTKHYKAMKSNYIHFFILPKSNVSVCRQWVPCLQKERSLLPEECRHLL